MPTGGYSASASSSASGRIGDQTGGSFSVGNMTFGSQANNQAIYVAGALLLLGGLALWKLK